MDPFVGEIRIAGFNYAPSGWALCQGQFLPINQNTALFSLLGTTYGEDGRTTFALPNLSDRIALHRGTGLGLSPYAQGDAGGSASVQLTSAQMPLHGHTLPAVALPLGAASIPSSTVVLSGGGGRGTGHPFYTASLGTAVTMANAGSSGGSAAHNNMSPYLVLNYMIALQGIFPQRP